MKDDLGLNLYLNILNVETILLLIFFFEKIIFFVLADLNDNSFSLNSTREFFLINSLLILLDN